MARCEKVDADVCVPGPPKEGLRSDDIMKLTRTKQMSARERWQRTLVLWPYIVPLTLVYFAEYSMQVDSWQPQDPAL